MQVEVVVATGLVTGYGPIMGSTEDPLRAIVDLREDQVGQLLLPGTKTLRADGTLTVIPPPPPPIEYTATTPISVPVLRTVGAGAVELWRLSLAITTGFKLRVEWIAVDAINGAIKTQETRATIERLMAGPLLIGRTDDPPHVTAGAAGVTAGVAGWTVAAAFVGNDLVLSAVGAAGRTVDWSLTGTIRRFGPGGLA